ncbi:hypothetical protein AB0K20_20985 [Micromonospora matsumotoense]|uniref:hypothetical protein n=1 Tax=Micromonospora matsumotoense TaxID=121616 RepID=UPI00341AD687
MNEFELEAGSIPVADGTTSKRWLLLTVPVVVLALLLAVVVMRGREPAPQRPPATQGARGEPVGYPPSPTPTRSGPAPAFAGMTPGKVTDAWVERWPAPVTVDRSVRNLQVTLPGTQDKLSATVGQPTKDRRNEVGHVACLVKHRGPVQRSLLKTLVEGCLGPVLKVKERTTLLDWLISSDLSVPRYQFRRTDRFELLADHTADTSFALFLNAR